MPKKIPVTIFTGFLGSGKTTIILNLIDYLHSIGQQVVYIKNEIGTTDIDAEIVKEKNIETKKLLNGCVYHTLVGPITHAVDDLIDKFNPDRIIIETAGTDETSNPIVLGINISSHPRLVRDGIITVIDVVNFNNYKFLDDYNRDQSNFIDLIVFNKVELVDEERKRAVVAYVREFNERSPIVEAVGGKLNPHLAFGMNISTEDEISQDKGAVNHFKADHINTFTYTSDQTFDENKLENAFLNLPKNVIRYKGYVKTSQGMKIINGVYKRFDWMETSGPTDTQTTRLVIIGYEVKDSRLDIINQLDACVTQS